MRQHCPPPWFPVIVVHFHSLFIHSLTFPLEVSEWKSATIDHILPISRVFGIHFAFTHPHFP